MNERVNQDDPVVARVREAREALARECGFDVKKMAELFKSMEAEHPDRVRRPDTASHKTPTRK